MSSEWTVLATHAVGFIASLTAFVLFVPQARRTWQLRNDSVRLAGISTGTPWLVILNAVLWFVYGWLEQAFWIAAPGIVNLPMAAATIIMVTRAQADQPLPQPPPCPACQEGVWHRRMVTAPPGWGSTRACDGVHAMFTVVYTSEEELRMLRKTPVQAAELDR